MSFYSGPPVSPGHPCSDPQALPSLASPNLTPLALCTVLPPTSAPPWSPPPGPGSQHALPPRPAHPSICWPLARAAGLPSARPTFLFFRALGSTQPPWSPVIHRDGGQDFCKGLPPPPAPQTGRPGPESGAGQRKSLWRV